jgi:hypothetical protein
MRLSKPDRTMFCCALCGPPMILRGSRLSNGAGILFMVWLKRRQGHVILPFDRPGNRLG